jgi:aminopeptidase YwaD
MGTKGGAVMCGATAIIDRLCGVEGDRRPGSPGNRQAVAYVAARFADAGWAVDVPDFPCLDWTGGTGRVVVRDAVVPIVPSPYGLGVRTAGPVRVVRTVDDLRRPDLTGSVLVATGELTTAPLTPKRYPFYQSDHDAEVIEAIESARPQVVLAITGTHPDLCGAVDPFPWIEDGDFPIPAASVRAAEAGLLLTHEGDIASVEVEAERRPSVAQNVVARRGPHGARLTIAAHIDTKPGTPGAVDNAASVAALVLAAERLGDRPLPIGVELLAVNGEDHFAAPGERAWLEDNEGALDQIELFVNADGAGYRRGRTAYSFYNVDDERRKSMRRVLDEFEHLVEGPAWFQSDHAIFAGLGRPALAFTTELVSEMLVELFHAPTDTPDQVAPERVSELATALERLVMTW